MKVDINLLPEEYRPKHWVLPLTVGLIIVILVVGYYGHGFYDKNVAANSEVEQLQSQLDSVNAEIAEELADTTIEEYQALIAEAEVEIDVLKAVEKEYETYNADRIYWRPVLQTVRELAPTDVIITSFRQKGNELTVKGELSSDVENTIPIIEYARLLETRGILLRSPSTEIGTEQRQTGEDGETEEIFVFTMLLEVKLGG